MRVAAGAGAWLLGVGAATAGSLLAVSLLGQGIATNTSQQLTESTVKRALAAEASETSAAAVSPPALTPSQARPRKTQSPTTPHPQTTPSARPAASSSAPAPTAHPTSSTAGTPASASPSASKVLTSQGGTVVAECLGLNAYLLSWTPTQGYEVGRVARGPAATAQATFEGITNSVTMSVSCAAGVPTATITVGDA